MKKNKSHAKRRPRHEKPSEMDMSGETTELNADIAETADDEINTEAQNEGVHPEEHEFNHYQEPEPTEKVHLDFYGSDLIRQKAPKVMDLADSVADQWQKDGEFKDLPLPVNNELAQVLAGAALRKAKDVEKKLEEKGVFMMARIGLDYAKSKLKKRD